MTPDLPIQLVVFDLGRVLLRICDGYEHACRLAGVELPTLNPDPQLLMQLHAAVCGAETGRLNMAAFSREVAPLLGIAPEHVMAMSNAYLIGAYPGVLELFEELKTADVATACLTNTNDAHWEMMTDPAHRAYLPLDRLTWRFASHLIRQRKPEHAIYQYVERETQLAGPAIIFFDDVPENVDAARQRGWHAYRIDPSLNDPIGQARAALARHGVPV